MAGPWEKYGKPKGPWDKYAPNPAFDAAVERLLKTEGGYVNDPEDRGGETKYGISKKAHPELDIPTLTISDAKQIYKEKYWKEINADSLPPGLQEMAFDAAVNQGPTWTKRALARAKGDAKEFMNMRAKRYAAIVRADPTQKKFTRGWEKRLEAFDGPWLKYKQGE